MHQTDRQKLIDNWLHDFFNHSNYQFYLLTGDASFRKYFRVETQDSMSGISKTYILMDAPPDKEPIAPFIASTQILKQKSISVPTIHHQDQNNGLLLLDDFGDKTLLTTLNSQNAENYYSKAIRVICDIQKLPAQPQLPIFNTSELSREFNLFEEWFLLKLAKQSQIDLQPEYDYLIEKCLEQPYTVTHRDFHSRNIMILDGGALGILDHQDLMMGPITYDLVSLIKDCYIDWPKEQLNHWFRLFCDLTSLAADKYFPYFELIGLQRHMKALGIFARQSLLYNNDAYLQYIPRVLKYIHDVADKDDKLRNLAKLIRNQL